MIPVFRLWAKNFVQLENDREIQTVNLSRTACMGIFLVGLAAPLTGCKTADPVATKPPTGGREFVLDEASFAAVVNPILTARGCDNIACHGGGLRGTYELSPADDKNVAFDFLQSARQVDPEQPSQSSLLMKPLAPAAGGDVHTADPEVSGFLSTDDPDYQAILAWIEAGEYR